MEANAARIIELLADGDCDVRAAAVEALASVPAVVEGQLEPLAALLNDGDWRLRESALKALASS